MMSGRVTPSVPLGSSACKKEIVPPVLRIGLPFGGNEDQARKPRNPIERGSVTGGRSRSIWLNYLMFQ